MMRPQKQLVRHDPENGKFGDCFRTALACVLDMDAADVPHFAEGGWDGDVMNGKAGEWLAERGLAIFTMYLNGDLLSLGEVLHHASHHNPGLPFLITPTIYPFDKYSNYPCFPESGAGLMIGDWQRFGVIPASGSKSKKVSFLGVW